MTKLLSDSELKKVGIQPERVSLLNNCEIRDNGYILYWMQADQRERFNPALEYAVLLANKLNKKLLVCFGITPNYPEATLRHYAFMIEGLQDVSDAFQKRDINLKIELKPPAELAIELAEKAAAVVTDRGYTFVQVEWRCETAQKISCPLIQIEGGVVVPVETAGDYEEYAARTIRPKINRIRDNFICKLKRQKLKNTGKINNKSLDIKTAAKLLNRLKIDKSVPASEVFKGGQNEAQKRLKRFINKGLPVYDKNNDPNSGAVSLLSPYLHFGQISPVDISLKIIETGNPNTESFLEQLIVRRELAVNFTYFSDHEADPGCLPGWAVKSLDMHNKDKREYTYSYTEFENSLTHDPAWNAAQLELFKTGHMHGYMRMYWGKKIIEWTENWQDAYKIMISLNNKYEIDGRDCNGYAGVAWCFGKHDTAWKERPIFGKVRYMNAAGLKRKFAINKYIEYAAAL
ncbi:MAG: deoxyribodipyrimidine photo-lyase [Planctomycetota bacterium]|jgi:deoxyribodipyrimidine photo-lyase